MRVMDKNDELMSEKPTQSTMADVARLAGVSAMTVSRALRPNSAIAAQTRARIFKIIEDIGYVPDMTAGGLSSRKSGFIAALVPTINNSNFADTARGLTEVLSAAGLQLLLGYTDYSLEREEALIEAMLRRRPEGVMLTGGIHTERTRHLLKNAHIPVVETWDSPSDPINHMVGFSNAEATKAMVHHLHARGYREIGFIGGGSTQDTRGSDRLAGYLAAVAELNLPAGRVITYGLPPISIEHGGEALSMLIAAWPNVDAVVCVSDLSAFGALSECHRRGLKVPQNIAIAGFGDFDLSRWSWPKLTTVSVNAIEIGRRSGSILLEALKAPSAHNQIDRVAFSIIQRETT